MFAGLHHGPCDAARRAAGEINGRATCQTSPGTHVRITSSITNQRSCADRSPTIWDTRLGSSMYAGQTCANTTDSSGSALIMRSCRRVTPVASS